MKRQIILGIDTSNYTTSLGIVDIGGEVVANLKRPLPVKLGECGLRQSDAVFAHIKNLPDIMREARGIIGESEILCVGVSEKPRNEAGSYMPSFLTGVAAAESIAATMRLPLYRFSHQCGHIMAAIHSSGAKLDFADSFAAFHISGGTTELVRVTPSECGFNTEIVGYSSDLNAGQAIDRIGVMMGLKFPAGAEIEKLALKNNKKIPTRKPSVKGTVASLSGLQNLSEKLYKDTCDKALVSAFALEYIANTLKLMRGGYVNLFGAAEFIFAGGVMSNSIIKARLAECGSHFCAPEFSADNAVGTALLARRAYLSEKK